MGASGFNVAKILAMKLKTLILFFLNLFKRALCIFRKRAPASPVLPVVVADTHSATYDIPEDDVVDNDSASWDSWDSGFQTTASASVYPAAGNYQAQSTLPSDPSLPQPTLAVSSSAEADVDEEPDYFADMTPASFKAPKIVVKKKAAPTTDGAVAGGGTANSFYSNRFAVADNASDGLALAPPQELEAMDDWDQPMGEENMWADEENEELDWEVEFALRETRRQELERKKWEQQQRRVQREMQKARTHSQSSSSHFQTIQSMSH